MTNKILEENFKTLFYDFAEINWGILKEDAFEKFINNNEPFNEAQLEDLKAFVNDLLQDIEEEKLTRP